MSKEKEDEKENNEKVQKYPYITTEGTRCFVPTSLTISTTKTEYRDSHFFQDNPEGTRQIRTYSPVTTPTNSSSYLNWDVIYDSSSGSVRIDLLKTRTIATSSSGDDSVTTLSLVTTTEGTSTELTETLTLAGDVSSYESAS